MVLANSVKRLQPVYAREESIASLDHLGETIANSHLTLEPM
jgi:hypothetical protein